MMADMAAIRSRWGEAQESKEHIRAWRWWQDDWQGLELNQVLSVVSIDTCLRMFSACGSAWWLHKLQNHKTRAPCDSYSLHSLTDSLTKHYSWANQGRSITMKALSQVISHLITSITQLDSQGCGF
jgi:hypothetical protein